MSFTIPTNTYFAAANGFEGFRSYFDAVFFPKDFLKLYVIKGGPGTGKSSFMKSICRLFDQKGFDTEAILCSSDPESLDGIIINSPNGKVGLLDGTAPHESDTRLPGAVDEIVNLGENWNSKYLTKNRDEIITLNNKKSAYYKNGYEYLKLAGYFFFAMNDLVSKAYTKNDKAQIDDIISDIQELNQGRKSSVKLFSSFGRSGYHRIPTFSGAYKNIISITGVMGSEYIFMNRLLRVAEFKNALYTRYPSPYSDDLTEGIFFPGNNTLIVINAEVEKKINTRVFLDEDVLASVKEKADYYLGCFNDLIARAKTEFSYASSTHFELEKIYVSAMNFEKNNIAFNNIVNEIIDLIK